MPAVVAKLDDLVEKDPGLLGRIVAVIVVVVMPERGTLASQHRLDVFLESRCERDACGR